MNTHELYMYRCLELARNGLGNVAPNPMVGAVVVHKGKIIGEGYHRQYGKAHAEVNAINAVKDKSLLKESTIYVNLEPCVHFGKTPPCTDLIIREQIPEVVVGCIDIFPEVAGKGIAKLRKSGCKVTVGVLEKESIELNRRFITFHQKQRPYLILKWAQTLDGYMDAIRTPDTPREPIWITSELAKSLVHKWRTEETSIMVATNTAQKDNPKLSARIWPGNNPMRIVLDRSLRLSPDLYLFDKSIPTLVFTEKQVSSEEGLEYVQIPFDEQLPNHILKQMYQRRILSAIVEGGGQWLRTLIEHDLWDEARVFVGNKFFGGGTLAPTILQKPIKQENLGESLLYYYRNNDLILSM